MLLVIFLLLIFLPFLPGLIELIKPKDAFPLFINLDYSKNPRYFALSFKKKLFNTLKIEDVLKSIEESENIELIKEEIKLSKSITVLANSFVERVLFVSGNLTTEENVFLAKEVYVTNNAYIGENNKIRALACEGSVYLKKNTTILRWLDAEKDIFVDENCDLGVSTTSNSQILLQKGDKFKRLFSKVILTKSTKPYEELPKEGHIKGSIKNYDSFSVKGNIEIEGSIFGEKDITVGENVKILGNVFSQGKIKIKDNATIGEAGSVKSVIAKKGITIGENVKVYGYVMTEGEGKVV